MNEIKKILNKVPEITLYFWIIKVLCTTVGETFADFLNINLNIGLTGTSIIMGILLVAALFFQFKASKYIPGVYWLTAAFISVFGTLVTDNLTDSIGVPLETSTILFSILLALTFILWYRSEKTLSIHSIFTKRRESFYWLTILFTFALGTATGDLMAESLGLGYLTTGIIVAVIILLASLSRRAGLNSVLSFWIIYIMTRPLGASIGDYLSQPSRYGGLGLGATMTSILFIFGIIGLVIFLSFTKRDVIEIANTKEDGMEEGKVIKQTIATVLIFLIVGISAYVWRQDSLKISNHPSINSSVESSTAATTILPLGDLSTFKKITEDTRAFVAAGDLSGAKTRVSDLEYEWDNAEAKLRPMNQAKWTEIDNAIDKMLRQVRAVNPDSKGCEDALDALLTLLEK
ncbi:MAG: hypothetical protein V4469_00970 [Patescibacteria group bacterium]